MPLSNGLRLLPLLRCEHGIERPAGAGDDRVELWLDLPAHRAQLAPLPVHDRIDSGLLIRRQPDFTRKAVPELAISRRPSVGAARTVPGTPMHLRQQDQSVGRDATDTPSQNRNYKHQNRQ